MMNREQKLLVMRRHWLTVAIGNVFMLALAGTAVGQTWTDTGPIDTYWGAVACSADGSKVMAVPNSSFGVYLSTNAGGNWTIPPLPLSRWNAVACSADGSKLYASAGGYLDPNVLYVSTNGGLNWATNALPGFEISANRLLGGRNKGSARQRVRKSSPLDEFWSHVHLKCHAFCRHRLHGRWNLDWHAPIPL